MSQTLATKVQNAATDPQIDPRVRVFLAELNKDSSAFWELPQPKPQEILTALQNKTRVDMSGVTTTSSFFPLLMPASILTHIMNLRQADSWLVPL